MPRRTDPRDESWRMLVRMLNVKWLEDRKEYGMFFVRMIVGFHLLYGVVDNVFSWPQMLEFRDFLAARGTPFPLVGAIVSVTAMFVCAILYILGWFTRYAAIVMIINFVCALAIAHRVGGYPNAALALIMLFSSIALLIHGPGKPAID
ncbi:MAG TPA: DoxX family protein [Thermoanaerobaculia bacterium]|nr:DoxX family protein [Thermoanaerobaculia bacterium]